MGDNIIEAIGIRKLYGDLEVLNVPNIEVKQGLLTCIVGPSGAGKSTLLHILGTLLRPTEGQIFLNGRELSKLNDRELAEFRNRHLGFVFQHHNLLPELTALENVCLPALIANKSRDEYMPEAERWLKVLGMESRSSHKPGELSGGEQQRISVARALINDPQLILADEPSGNLDTANAMRLHELFDMLKSQYGYTILVVTHNADLAKQSDRLVNMKDGRIVD